MKILVIVAHPDDEVLGCGGTIARLTSEGYEVFTLILGEGITSRDNKRDEKDIEKDISELKAQAQKANHILGVKRVFSFDFPDNRFDTVALLDIIKVIEKVKNEIKPDTVFTHHAQDLNIDHKIVFEAVMTATRPLSLESVKEIYSFEILSSSEWSFTAEFLPNTFFDITKTLDIKIRSMKEYSNEIREYPHPRSIDGIRLNAQNWGLKTGIKYAEALKLIRNIK